MKKYYKEEEYIHYSNCHEDVLMLLRHLSSKDKKVLSVASALDNSLAFLTNDKVMVDAFDFNITQVHLCELKKEAIRNLTQEEFLLFYGITDGDRKSLYEKATSSLQTVSREYFDKHKYLIDNVKLVNCGKFEYYFQIFAEKVLPMVTSKRHIKEFALEKDINRQQVIYNRYINTLRFRMMFKVFFSKLVMKRLGRDKAFFKYNKGSLSKDIKNRFDMGIKYNINGTNPYLNYVLLNNYVELPFYLKKENYMRIQKNIDHIHIVHKTFDEMLELDTYDFMNLSDIFEYMPNEVMKNYSSKIRNCLSNKGKVAFWNMVNSRELDLKRVNNEKDLERDRAMYYKAFLVYENEK